MTQTLETRHNHPQVCGKKTARHVLFVTSLSCILSLISCGGNFEVQGLRGLMSDKARSFNDDILQANLQTVSTDSLNGTWIAAVSSELQVTLVAVDTNTGLQLKESNPIVGLENMGVEDALDINSSFKILQSAEDPTLYNMTKCGTPSDTSAFRALRDQNTLTPQLNENAILNPNTAAEGVNLDLPTLSGFIAFETPGLIDQNKKVVFDQIDLPTQLFIGTLNNVNASLFPNNQISANLQAEIDRFKVDLANTPDAILNLRFNNKAKMSWLKVLDDTQTALGAATINGTTFDLDCFHFAKRSSGSENLTGSASKLSHVQYHVADASGNTFINIEEQDQPSVDPLVPPTATTQLIHQTPSANGNVITANHFEFNFAFLDPNGNKETITTLMNTPDAPMPAFIHEIPLAHINQNFLADLLQQPQDGQSLDGNGNTRLENNDVLANHLVSLDQFISSNRDANTGIFLQELFLNIDAQQNGSLQNGTADRDEILAIFKEILDRIRGNHQRVAVEQTAFSTTDDTLRVDTFDVTLQNHTVQFSTTVNAVETAGNINISF